MEILKLRMKTIRGIIFFLVILCVAGICFGQEQEQDQRKIEIYDTMNDPPDHKHGKLIVFYGSGINNPVRSTEGGSSTNSPRNLTNFGLALEFGLSLELGYLKPADGSSSASGAFFSSGVTYPMPRGIKIGWTRFELSPTLGYTRMFGTGNAVNFGAGLDAILSKYYGIRFEARDYFKLSGNKEHNVVFRIAFFRRFEGM